MAPYNPPVGTNYSQVKLAVEEIPHIFRIMGKGGKWFKTFTQNNRLKYVWFNKDRGVIELWGAHDVLEKSVPIMERRINNVMSKIDVSHEVEEVVIPPESEVVDLMEV